MKILIGCIILCLAVMVSAQQVEKKITVPAQFEGKFDSTHTLSLDKRFNVSLYYIGGLEWPRYMSMSPSGVLHIADLGTHTVYAIKDTNNDGVGDTAIGVTPPVDSVHCVAFYKQYLLAAEPTRVRKFEDTDGDGFYETELPYITGIGGAGTPPNHFTRTLYIDSEAGYIYVTVGAPCNACRTDDTTRAAVLRFNLDGTGRMVYAKGLRNAIGISKDPFGNMWVTNADRNFTSDDHPREMITHIREGGFYGWPLAFEDHQWDDFSENSTFPEYHAMLPITHDDSIKVENMDLADIYLTAHSTPMAIMLLQQSTQLYDGVPTFLVSVHGSYLTSRTVATGYNMIKVQYNFTTKQWVASPFADGFLTDSLTYNYWARPCGLLEDSVHHAIYLSSDAGTKAIFKLTVNSEGAVKSQPTLNEIKLYPNPAHSSFTVAIPRTSAHASVEVFDLLGRPAAISTVGVASGIQVQLLEAQPASRLFCRVKTANTETILPLIIE